MSNLDLDAIRARVEHQRNLHVEDTPLERDAETLLAEVDRLNTVIGRHTPKRGDDAVAHVCELASAMLNASCRVLAVTVVSDQEFKFTMRATPKDGARRVPTRTRLALDLHSGQHRRGGQVSDQERDALAELIDRTDEEMEYPLEAREWAGKIADAVLPVFREAEARALEDAADALADSQRGESVTPAADPNWLRARAEGVRRAGQ